LLCILEASKVNDNNIRSIIFRRCLRMNYFIKKIAVICVVFTFSILSQDILAAENNYLSDHVSQQLVDSQTLNQLTKDLLTANTLTTQHRSNLTQMTIIAKERLKKLQEVLARDPATALRYAFSNKVRDSFPLALKKYLEENVYDQTGTYDALCATSEKNAQTFYHLRKMDGKYFQLAFVALPIILPQSGDKIKIAHAILIPGLNDDGHLLVLEDLKEKNFTKVSINPPYPTTGVFRTLAILVNFQDQPTNKPWTTDQVKATIANDVSSFDFENSFQKTSLTADATGYYTIPYNSSDDCTTIYRGMMSQAISKANAAGVVTANYDRIAVVYPRSSNCPWVGLGWIGGGKPWGQIWINGIPTKQIIGHEMGHNFGLYHSHSMTCSGGTIGGTCTISDYGDSADIMGNKTATHFAASQKETLGWLDNPGIPGITTVQTSGTYVLEPYETNTLNRKAIRIPSASPVNATSAYYYLEYRQPIGHDAALTGNLTKGVILRKGTMGGTGTSSNMLNMTPSDTSFFSAAITPGAVFTDPAAPNNGVTIAVTAADATGATLSVNFGAAPACVRANPTLTINPNTTTWVTPGGSATYVITLKNNDSAACANSTFNLSVPPVANVTSSLNSSSLPVAPGVSATVNLTLAAGTSTPSGVYVSTVNAINSVSSSNQASITASLGVQRTCVHINPTVKLSPATQTGTAGGNVSYNMTVINNDTAECTASNFNFTTTTPSGLTAALSQSTASINPGVTASLTLQATSTASTRPATYNLSASAVNATASTFTGTGSASYVITNGCAQLAPTLTITPLSQSTSGTTPVNYAVTIKNNNDASCGTTLFGSSGNSPTPNIKTFFEPYNHLIPAGGTDTAVFTLTPIDGLTTGNYPVEIVIGSSVLTHATVNLVYQKTPCVRATPTITLSPSSQTGPAGGNLSYTMTVINNDSGTCLASNFNFVSTAPTGISTTLGQTSAVINPGASATTTLQAASGTTTAAASYALTATATNTNAGTYTSKAAANYVVTSGCIQVAPTLTITPTSQSTTGVTPVNYAITIKNNNSASCVGTQLMGSSGNSPTPNIKTFFEPYNHRIASGATDTAVFTLTPLTGLAPGTYPVEIVIGGPVLIHAVVNLTYKTTVG
jgi:uncharacterized membrane protein